MSNLVVIGLAAALGVGVILAIAWYDARPLNKFRQQSRREAQRRRAERASHDIAAKPVSTTREAEIRVLEEEIASRQSRLTELQTSEQSAQDRV